MVFYGGYIVQHMTLLAIVNDGIGNVEAENWSET